MFEVSAVRVCQIVSRVRRWVDDCVAEWLFPRRDDLRFYAALASAGVEVQEVEGEREAVVLVGPGWSYRRGRGQRSEVGGQRSELEQPSSGPSPAGRGSGSVIQADANTGLTLSAGPLNSLARAAGGAVAASARGDSDCVPPHVELLGRRLAELLVEWQKSRRLSGAVRTWH